ncbi:MULTISPECIES: zinc-dependent alcohol dehydrogenase [Robinsoniella]|uniref:zinc-dependent alcohol dehydrogenase n=1 Tax=Robinsoniella TaxID=588605 RepID=UPI0004875688|nr:MULTISPECIES: zinc-binding dehydrogenase [Robinsoniella]
MKSLIVEKDGTLLVKEIPVPRYSSKQALVKTISCGICNGTDAKLIHRQFKGFNTEMYPLMLGHEGVGEVVELGSEVTSFHVGDKVLLPFVDPDPELYGSLQSAWGAFSEYAVVHDLAAYPKGTAPECAYAQTILPDFVDPVDGAMIITLREVLSSIKRFGIKEGDSVAVFGCGPVGQTFIKFLSLLGIQNLIAFDIIDEKLQEAKERGAAYAFNSQKVSVNRKIHEIFPSGVQYVLDAVGMTSLINQAMEYICDGGKICCYGISPTCEMNLDWSRSGYNWQLQFQQFPSKAEEGQVNEQINEWLKKGTIRLKDYISDYFSFSQISDAFARLERREISKKGIIIF